MTATTSTTTATAPFTNETYRDIMRAHGFKFPAQIRYSGRVYTKFEGVGTPEYFTSTRNNWLAGIRAIELIGAGQATEVNAQ